MPARRPAFLRAACLLVALACGDPQPRVAPDTPASQRQRDSAVARSGLPGSQGVDGAMRLQDAQASRNAQLDSLARQP